MKYTHFKNIFFMLLIGHALIHNHSVEKIYHKTGQILSIDTLVDMYVCIVFKH